MSVYFSPHEHGFFEDHNRPDDAIAISDDVHWSLVEGLARGEVIVINDAGEPELTERVISIAELASGARAEIERALAAELNAGMPYTLPDGTEDVIQTRPDQDEANLLGLAIEARDLRAAGETGAVMSLRARSNTVHALTPEQMIALTDAAKSFKQAMLAKSWALKDAVSAAETAGDRQAIETITWTTDTTTEEIA
ncbi:DUF4376 domain-containing protein [Salinicola acroporae]|uniref:DUF4376 domain-containing protein n=1 Tax=Salinicola acroporae TaxID=1541440 RepID=A0ABT6I061_9GAMM|nr:DUF4376 domain-containing protein [Salinicola acroporae]MDH4571104.1 hypothetical protein [Salinicola acroporae]